MAYWLMKTEPEDYSWTQLVTDGAARWDGVHNHQAASNMRAMKRGDRAFFYRSMQDPAVVGVMEIVREAYRIQAIPSAASRWSTCGRSPRRSAKSACARSGPIQGCSISRWSVSRAFRSVR